MQHKAFPTSARADKTLVYAIQNAQECRLPPNSVHVLYGLLLEGGGIGGYVLNTFCGWTPEYINSFALNEFAPQMGKEEMVFDILERAHKIAIGLGQNYVGTEHLLLAILADGQSAGSRMFKLHNIDLNTIEDKLMNVLGKPGYTRSYIKDDAEFWATHWSDWHRVELPDENYSLSLHSPDGAVLSVTLGGRIGFVICKAPSVRKCFNTPSVRTSFVNINGVRTMEVICQRDQVAWVRALVISFVMAMKVFQE